MIMVSSPSHALIFALQLGIVSMISGDMVHIYTPADVYVFTCILEVVTTSDYIEGIGSRPSNINRYCLWSW